MVKDQLTSKRLALYNNLTNIVEEVHYQPPANVRLTYPCIVYRPSDIKNQYANNIKYLGFHTFSATLMTEDIDSVEVEEFIGASSEFVNILPVDGLYNINCNFNL